MTATAVQTKTKAQEQTQALQTLETLAEQYSLTVLEARGRFERALMIADGISALRTAVAPIIERVMPLQNNPLGFMTDKRDTGYPADVVRDCLIEATLRGVSVAGNEFNIIAGRCYVTLNGFRRLMRELPGFTDLKLYPGVPKAANGGAVVPFKATWKYQGKADQLEREIPVRINAGMGVDAILGKANRKMLASIYSQITGSEHSDGEVGDDGPAAAVVTRTEQLAEKLGARNGANGATNGNGSHTADHSAAPGKRQLERIAKEAAEIWGEEFELILRDDFGVNKVEDLTADQAAEMEKRIAEKQQAVAAQ